DRPTPSVEAARVTPQREEHLLHDILRQRLLGQDPPRQREGGPPVPVVQRLEGARVLLGHEFDQLAVPKTPIGRSSHALRTLPARSSSTGARRFAQVADRKLAHQRRMVEGAVPALLYCTPRADVAQ